MNVEQPNEALERARVALELRRYPEAVREAQRAVANAPEHVDAYGYLAQAYLGNGESSLAEKTARQGLAMRPDSEWLHRILAVSLRSRAPKEALEAVDESIRLRPSHVLGHKLRGDILRDLKRRLEALESYQRALSFDPESADLHESLGSLFLEERKWIQAETHFRQSLAVEPENVVALNNLGVALNAMKRPEEARLAFQSAVLLDPTLKVAKQNLHSSVRGYLRVGAAGGGIAIYIVLQVLSQGARHGGRALGESGMPLALIGLIVSLVTIVGFVVHKRNRRREALKNLELSEPQLFAIFQRIDADKKRGLLR